VQCDQTN